MEQLTINQSLIKKFFYKGVVREYCPHSIYCESIVKTHSRETLAMTAGNYGETLCIGSGVGGNKVLDMPRKKLTAKQILKKQEIGDKTIDQIRIEKQAMNFERLCFKYEINIQKELNTQVEIVKKYSENDNIMLIGNLDIFPHNIKLPQRGLRVGCTDLKFTGRFTNFGEFCWADPENLDKTQGWMYSELLRDFDYKLNMDYNPNSKLQYLYNGKYKDAIDKNEILFFFWVFNYKEGELKNMFIEVEYNATAKADLYQSIKNTINEINSNERHGWNRVLPTFVNCKMCAVTECKNRIAFKPVEEEHQSFQTI